MKARKQAAATTEMRTIRFRMEGLVHNIADGSWELTLPVAPINYTPVMEHLLESGIALSLANTVVDEMAAKLFTAQLAEHFASQMDLF